MDSELVNQLTAYTAIFSMAIIPIWIGSHLSLSVRGMKVVRKGKVVVMEETKDGNKMESMSSEDAWKFPFIGSGVLFGLYLLFKIFSKEYINLLLTAYFLLFGVLAVSATIKNFVEPLFPKQKLYKLPFTPFWRSKEEGDVEFGNVDILCLILAAIIGGFYSFTKNWILNNIIGLAFSVQGIALLSLSSYKIASILLGGLFFYDIFWVFGTDVMVTVAKSFDAPIKLLFPKQIFADHLEFSMLGLGDIVIPGLFVALLLRFDAKRSNNTASFSKTYFYFCYLSYFLGLMTTILVMHTFKAAQPALLYLVPACLGGSFLLAVIRGEVSLLLSYSEEAPQKQE